MRKILSLLLAVLMIVPLFAQVNVAAANATNNITEDVYRADMFMSNSSKELIDWLCNDDAFVYSQESDSFATDLVYITNIFSWKSKYKEAAKEILVSFMEKKGINIEDIRNEERSTFYYDLISGINDMAQMSGKYDSLRIEMTSEKLESLFYKSTVGNYEVFHNEFINMFPKDKRDSAKKMIDDYINSSEYSKKIQNTVDFSGFITEVISIAKNSVDTYIELKTYNRCDEQLIDFCYYLSQNSQSEYIKEVADELYEDLSKTYEESRNKIIVNIAKQLATSTATTTVENAISKIASSLGWSSLLSAAKIGIDAGNFVSDQWFSTKETNDIRISMRACADLTVDLKKSVSSQMNSYKTKYTSKSSRDDAAKKLIYYTNLLYQTRIWGETLVSELKETSYHSDIITTIHTLGIYDFNKDIDSINQWVATLNKKFDNVENQLFRRIDPSEYATVSFETGSAAPSGNSNKTVGSMTSSSSKNTYTTDEKVVITWTKADNATRYGLTIVNNATNEKVVNASNFTGTSYTVGKLPAGTYRFNMCGYNSNGNAGPISALKQFTIVNNTSSGSNGKYNAAAAIEYGKNHWNDGKGLCAEFVSNCLKAGGSSAWYVGCTTLVKQLQEENWGTLHKLNVNSNGTISLEKNKSILSPGDPIFVYSSGCLSVDGKPYVHVYLYYDTDSNGNLKGYAHNNASNGTIDVYYTCAYCGKPTDAAYVFHMDSSDSKQTPDNNETNTQEYADVHEGTYVINSIVNDYRYLTAKTDSNGGQVEAKPFENIDAQLFEIIECKDGYQIICKNSSSGRVINVYRDGTSKNGDNVTLWESTKDGTQIWLFEKNGDAYAIHPSDNKNIALTAGNTGKVTVSSYTGASNQLWKLSLQREEPEQYTVTYNGNGGTGIPKEQTKTAGEDLKLSSTVPIKEGHTFKGWATTKTGSVSYKSGEQYASDKDITLYAVWEANTYTISYNANGGSGTPKNQTKKYAESIKLSTQEPTRKDYIFLGWSTSPDGSVEYGAGSNFTLNENVTLYAIWQKEENEVYYIIYNANGGQNAPSMQTKNEDENAIISNIVPAREGYTFDGWAIGDSDTVAYSSGDVYKENKTLYLHAVWTANTYNISYNANGGANGPKAQIKTHDKRLVLSETIPVKEGFTFVNWYDGVDVYNPGSIFEKNADTVLSAVWEKSEEEKFPFVDVPEDAWYKDDVKNAYEKGIVNGKGENRYAPEDNMTYAEAIKIACTIYQLYNDGEVSLKNGKEVWYSTFMEYAIENGIIRSDYSAVADKKITRKDFVNIFYGALPVKEFTKINNVGDNSIPDVKIGDAYSGEIYTFYRAGILTGSDSKGSFMPDSNIKRNEVCAIVTRMLDSGARKSITLN